MKKIFTQIFSMPFMALLFVFYIVAMGTATFVENDFGTPAARKLIYNAWWFELIMTLLVMNLVANIFKYKLYTRPKWSVLLFHVSFIFLFLGAAATRYIGFEGTIHLREGQQTNEMLSEHDYLSITINDEQIQEKVNFIPTTFRPFSKTINDVTVHFNHFIPNAQKVLTEVDSGQFYLNLVYSENGEMVTKQLKQGNTYTIRNSQIACGTTQNNADFVFIKRNNQLFLTATDSLQKTTMSKAEKTSLLPNTLLPLETKVLYTGNNLTFIITDILLNGKEVFASQGLKIATNQTHVLTGQIEYENQKMPFELIRTLDAQNNIIRLENGDKNLTMSYGVKKIQLPFTIKLRDFQLERYSGSESPASYASEVSIIDNQQNINFDYRVYMNHVLDYRGYRFFQSSYDTDEKGSILSVNNDKIGTYLTYFSYLIMAIGMLWALLDRNTYFHTLIKANQKLRKARTGALLVLLLLSPLFSHAQTYKPINQEHALHFGKLYTRGQDGRIKNISTLSSEVLRKISRQTNWKSLTPEQVFVGFTFHAEHWMNEPMIRIADKEMQKHLNITGKYVAFNQLLNIQTGQYKLKHEVDAAYEKSPAYRNKFDKEVIKIDEKLNILYMLFTGKFMNIFPNPGDINQKWVSFNNTISTSDPSYQQFYGHFAVQYKKALTNEDWTRANELVDSIGVYQHQFANNDLPSAFKAQMEFYYEKWQIFDQLFKWYGVVGFVLLVILFVQLLKPKIKVQKLLNILVVFPIVLFIVHTLGLALRWYISGHAPWSDGYEAMVYIAWSLMLAGVFYARKSPITMAGAAVLSSIMLMVAHLSWMDPTITNLVPVLNSYWLTIHVSIITASYGFLGLASLLGFLSLILMLFLNPKNTAQLHNTLKELVHINQLNIIIGLYMLTVGTFLGGVWANESWGRYWGWDPKETWALISVVVYAFIAHMRYIPKLKGLYIHNLVSLSAYSAIMMTFFGVNYYLSGLHSYAKGDPVPVPNFIYYIILVIIMVAILAYQKYKTYIQAKK